MSKAIYREDVNLDQAFVATVRFEGQAPSIQQECSLTRREEQASVWESRMSEENDFKSFVEVNIFCRYFIRKMIM